MCMHVHVYYVCICVCIGLYWSIFVCIYLGIVFANEHVWAFMLCFVFDYIVSHVHTEKEKKKFKKKKDFSMIFLKFDLLLL